MPTVTSFVPRRIRAVARALSLALALLALWVSSPLGMLPTAVAAETPEAIERRAQEIIRTTMSPFCPGRTLDSCPSPNAADWREDVRKWVAQGVPTQEIRKRLTARVPDTDITGAPSTALDAVLPILVAVIAVLLLFLLLRKLLTRRGEKPKTTPAAGGDLDRRLDEELARLDE